MNIDDSIKLTLVPMIDPGGRGITAQVVEGGYFEAPIIAAISETHKFAWASLVEGGAPGAVGKAMFSFKELVKKLNARDTANATLPDVVGAAPNLTKYLGGYPGHLSLSVQCRLFVYDDPQKDVYEPLQALRYMTYPSIKETGTYNMKKVSARIGNLITISPCIVQGFTYTYSQAMVNGLPAWCDVSLELESDTVITEETIGDYFGIQLSVRSAP